MPAIAYRLLPSKRTRYKVLREGRTMRQGEKLRQEHVHWVQTKIPQQVLAMVQMEGQARREMSLRQCVKLWGFNPQGAVPYQSSQDWATSSQGRVACDEVYVPRKYLDFVSCRRAIMQEIAAMKALHAHPNVLSLYEVLEQVNDSFDTIFLVLEMANGGELFDRVALKKGFDERIARYFFRQLMEGVSFCHLRGVCHRDLKLENLLLVEHGQKRRARNFGDDGSAGSVSITREDSQSSGQGSGADSDSPQQPGETPSSRGGGRRPSANSSNGSIPGEDWRDLVHCCTLRIADFGTSAILAVADEATGVAEAGAGGTRGTNSLAQQTQLRRLRSVVGSPLYVAPEVIAQSSQGDPLSRCDVFRKFRAWWHEQRVSLKSRHHGNSAHSAPVGPARFPSPVGVDWFFPSGVSRSARSLVLGLLNPDPEQRVSSREALAHPWVQESDSDSYSGDDGEDDGGSVRTEGAGEMEERGDEPPSSRLQFHAPGSSPIPEDSSPLPEQRNVAANHCLSRVTPEANHPEGDGQEVCSGESPVAFSDWSARRKLCAYQDGRGAHGAVKQTMEKPVEARPEQMQHPPGGSSFCAVPDPEHTKDPPDDVDDSNDKGSGHVVPETPAQVSVDSDVTRVEGVASPTRRLRQQPLVGHGKSSMSLGLRPAPFPAPASPTQHPRPSNSVADGSNGGSQSSDARLMRQSSQPCTPQEVQSAASCHGWTGRSACVSAPFAPMHTPATVPDSLELGPSVAATDGTEQPPTSPSCHDQERSMTRPTSQRSGDVNVDTTRGDEGFSGTPPPPGRREGHALRTEPRRRTVGKGGAKAEDTALREGRLAFKPAEFQSGVKRSSRLVTMVPPAVVLGRVRWAIEHDPSLLWQPSLRRSDRGAKTEAPRSPSPETVKECRIDEDSRSNSLRVYRGQHLMFHVQIFSKQYDGQTLFVVDFTRGRMDLLPFRTVFEHILEGLGSAIRTFPSTEIP